VSSPFCFHEIVASFFFVEERVTKHKSIQKFNFFSRGAPATPVSFRLRSLYLSEVTTYSILSLEEPQRL
jgi:hypothetical protein